MVKDYGSCSCGGRIHPQWFFGKKFLECAKCGNTPTRRASENTKQEEQYFVFEDGTTMIEAEDADNGIFLQWKIPYSEIRDYVNKWTDELKEDQEWRVGDGPYHVAKHFAHEKWTDEPYGMDWATTIEEAILSRIPNDGSYVGGWSIDEPMTKAEIRSFLTGIPSWQLTKRAETVSDEQMDSIINEIMKKIWRNFGMKTMRDDYNNVYERFLADKAGRRRDGYYLKTLGITRRTTSLSFNENMFPERDEDYYTEPTSDSVKEMKDFQEVLKNDNYDIILRLEGANDWKEQKTMWLTIFVKPKSDFELEAETKKLPPIEKAIDSGIASGATMEGLDLALGAEDWYGLKNTDRWSMDDWEGWTYEDNDGIVIYIDGPNGSIKGGGKDLDGMWTLDEAKAYLNRKGIPYGRVYQDGEWDSVQFTHPKEECYKHDWSGVFIEDAHYEGDDDGTGGAVFGQRCNYVLCDAVRQGHVGGKVHWDMAAEDFDAEDVEFINAHLRFHAEEPSAYDFVKDEIVKASPMNEIELNYFLDKLQNIPMSYLKEALTQAKKVNDMSVKAVLTMAINRRSFREEWASEEDDYVEMMECPHCSEFGDGEIPSSVDYDPGDRWEPPSMDVNTWETCEYCGGKGEVEDTLENSKIPTWDWDYLTPDEPDYDRYDAETSDYECSECGSHELRYRLYDDAKNNGFFCMNCGHSPCGINEIDNKPCTCDIMKYGKYTWLGEMPRTLPPFIPSQAQESFNKQEQDRENERLRIVGSKEKLDAIRKGAETFEDSWDAETNGDKQLEESIKRTKMSAIRTGLAITTFGIVLWNLWTNKKQEKQISDIMGLV